MYSEHFTLGLDSTGVCSATLPGHKEPQQCWGSLLRAAQAGQLPASEQAELKAPAPEQGSLFLPPFSCYKESKVTAVLL